MDVLQDRYRRVNIVNDQVSGWARKVHQKFTQLTDNMPELGKEFNIEDLTKVFSVMENVTVTGLKGIKENDANPADIGEEQFFDFGNDAFINKNIRVRPISGVTQGQADQTHDGRASNVSRTGLGGEGEQDEYALQE